MQKNEQNLSCYNISYNMLQHLWSSVAEWLECWTQVNFTRARGPGFDSWADPSKIARPQDSHVVTCPAGGPGKTRLTRPSTPSLERMPRSYALGKVRI